jgi:hypothetical protein
MMVHEVNPDRAFSRDARNVPLVRRTVEGPSQPVTETGRLKLDGRVTRRVTFDVRKIADRRTRINNLARKNRRSVIGLDSEKTEMRDFWPDSRDLERQNYSKYNRSI